MVVAEFETAEERAPVSARNVGFASSAASIMSSGSGCAPYAGLHLRNLRLPFPVDIVCLRGEFHMASGRRAGLLPEGATIRVPAYQLFHCEGASVIDLRGGKELHLVVQDEAHQPPPHAEHTGRMAMPAPWQSHIAGPSTLQLARAVFQDPGAPWSVRYAADALNLPAREFCRHLFREGSALTDIVREQRLMRVLLKLAGGRFSSREIALGHGFASFERLDAAFSDRFGCSAERVARLAWHASLSWSRASAATPARTTVRVGAGL
ncbi:hypothetical protein OR16_16602 [Cupriavidus basilensis OR16]|uniref:HTH araC/xylS-type domain-containing protein n=2 Tax=Cupriavidus basilensis TaxID=68895 RepID=H1S621_9BURK|nr:hypothetical protein OR16_16602 [Cupriavidus basilensis OR16]